MSTDQADLAIEKIVAQYLPAIYNFIYRLTGNAEEANDITQETFVKVWKNLKHYDPEKNPRAWLYKIARNTTIDWLRKKRPLISSTLDREGKDFDDNIPDLAPLPEELFQQKELGQKLEKVLSNISLDQRTVILLHHQDDLTFAEIAEITGKPLNTVKSQYRRGLLALRQHLMAEAPK